MTKTNIKIRIASMIYLFIAILTVPFVPPLGVFLMVPGVILLANSFLSLEELKQNKASLIIIDIISFLINIPAAVLITLSIDELSSIKFEKNNAPPSTENKRIDMLLKLGLLMILVSGILFATTTWEIVSNIIKVIILVGMGIIFLGLSWFSENKLKIKSTTKAYFILGLTFFLLTWIGIGFFGVISPWFSYTGEGKNYVYFITLILLSIFLYLIHYKFKEKEYLYIGHLSMYISIYYLLFAIGLDLLGATLIISILSLAINIIPNNKFISSVKNINGSVSYLYIAIIFTQMFDADKYIVLTTCLVNIINVLVLALSQKNKLKHILSMIISYILLPIGIGALTSAVDIDYVLVLFIALSVFSLLIKYQQFEQSKSLISTNDIIYNIVTTFIIINGFNNELRTLIISVIYMLIGFINSLDLYKTNDKVSFRYQPVTIFVFSASLIVYLNTTLVNMSDLFAFSLTSFIYAIIYQFSKKETTKKYYFVVLITSLILTYFINIEAKDLVLAVITLLLFIYLFLTRTSKDKASRILLYIAIVLNTYSVTHISSFYGIPLIITNLICLFIFILLSLVISDKKLETINYLSIIIPLYNLVYTIETSYNLHLILTNILWLYLLFLVIKFLIKNQKVKDLIGTIGLSLIMLPVIFQVDILVGIYVGILSIAIIFITFNEEYYKKLFYTGVIITIVNIIVQLWELWSQIPFYLYLLLVGLAIIAFVTYKEMHKKDAPKKIKEVKQEPNYNPQVVQFCPNCGTKNNGGKFCKNCGTNLQK